VGHPHLADAVAIDGSLEARNFTAMFARAGQVVAALLADRPRALPAAREAIEQGAER
jgi:hypothetical protein